MNYKYYIYLYIYIYYSYIIYYYLKQKLVEKRNQIDIKINDTIYLSNPQIESYGYVINKNNENNNYDIYTYKDKLIHYDIPEKELSFRNNKDIQFVGIITNITSNKSYNITFTNDTFEFDIEERFIKGKLESFDYSNFITSIEYKYKINKKVFINKIDIGSYVNIKNINKENCQIIKLNSTNCIVNINNGIIVTDVPYSEITILTDKQPIRKEDIKSKYSIGDVVVLNRYYRNYNFICYKQNSNMKIGNIIGYNFNLNVPIVKMKFDYELILNDKIEIENTLLIGDDIKVEQEDEKEEKDNLKIKTIQCKISYIFDNSNYYCEVKDSKEIILVEKNEIRKMFDIPKLLDVVNYKIDKENDYMLKCVIIKRNIDRTVDVLLKDGYLLERINYQNIKQKYIMFCVIFSVVYVGQLLTFRPDILSYNIS